MTSHRSSHKPLLALKTPFPLLPLRNGVLLPSRLITIPIGRARSISLAKDLVEGDIIGVAIQRDGDILNPSPADLYPIGTLAKVTRVQQQPRGQYQIQVEGLTRFKLQAVTRADPYWLADGEPLDLDEEPNPMSQQLAEDLLDSLRHLIGSNDLKVNTASPGLVADGVAAAINLPTEKELDVLFTLDPIERLRLVARLLIERKAMSDIKEEIDAEVRRGVGKNQREALLREQMKVIQRSLGEGAGGAEDALDKLRAQLDAADLSEEVRAVADRELQRLSTLSSSHPEYNVARSYLEWIAALPWRVAADTNDDIHRVEAQLEADHFGLEDVKRRILEHMAVLKLSQSQRGTLLCLAGPPGVGKTSLGQSIAAATGRPFARIALGGVRDEAEIRGHRRTYIGALPGRIIHALRKAGANNAVILLDEIDKLGRGWAGDPEAALLEVLDPEQNHTFTDHYMELPFDLSGVLFICTANNLSELSAPLRDRLEVIEIPGYTPAEKAEIATRHLIPKLLTSHGLPEGALPLSQQTLTQIITDYTREAGVRQLNRTLQKICRAAALAAARLTPKDTAQATPTDATSNADTTTDTKTTAQAIPSITTEDALKSLGKPKFFNDIADRTALPGVATGLAWTPTGGDILFIETTKMPGKGHLEITGQLGDVMKESARAALAYVRTHATSLGISYDTLERFDMHLHVPAGAIPKDGPSAGVTIFTALTSLLSNRAVRPDTAMTGECTLRGHVLPVGGIKAKVMAAHRAGIRRVILPARNAHDLDDIPADVLSQMTFILAHHMSEVLTEALEPLPKTSNPLPLDTLDPLNHISASPASSPLPSAS
jgi:ATP-dependent Lon protease